MDFIVDKMKKEDQPAVHEAKLWELRKKENKNERKAGFKFDP